MKFRFHIFTLTLLASLSAHSSDTQDAFVRFSKRFSSNEIYRCHGGLVKNLTLDISTPDGKSPGWKDFDAPPGSLDGELGQLLYVEAFEDNDKFLYYSWGRPAFDDDTIAKHAELKLHDGKSFVFDRYRPIPDINAEQARLDTNPFFKVTLNGNDTYECGIEYNPS